MTRPFDVMVAGHLCIDIIPIFPDTGATQIGEIMRPGKLVNMGDVKVSTGGPVSNTGINMKTLGCKVMFCARVGDDQLGQLTVEMLKKNGSSDGISLAENTSSSYTIVIAPPNIDRIFLHNPGTNNSFSSTDLDPELIAQCRHFHFGYPPLMNTIYQDDGEELMKVFQIAKQAGATTSCDMTLPDPSSESGKVNWRKVLQKILPHVDIYLPSVEETLYMLHPQRFLDMKEQHNQEELIGYLTPDDYSDLADELLSMGAKMASLKSGYRGFYVKTSDKSSFDKLGDARPADEDNWSNRQLWAPAYTVEKFGSATGSGDSSIAGFLTAYLKGYTVEQALKYATCCGWQNVQVLDAVSGIQPWDETTGMIEKNMPTIKMDIDSPQWKFIEDPGLWAGPGDVLNQS